jgi:hypothetical protein
MDSYRARDKCQPIGAIKRDSVLDKDRKGIYLQSSRSKLLEVLHSFFHFTSSS